MKLKEIFNSKLADEWRFLKFGRVAIPLIALLITLAMLVGSSIAWLTTNRNLGSNDMDMAIAIDDTSAIYKVYMCDLDTQKGIDRVKISEDSDEYEEITLYNLEMNQYDTIFKVQNKYTPAFAQINITRVSSMPESGTVYLTIDRDINISGMTADGELTPNVSSVMRFTAFIDSSKGDIEKTNANDLYFHINKESFFEEVKNYEGDKPHSKTFATHGSDKSQEGHAHTKADSITIAVEYKETDWYVKDGHQTLNVYLYITYDVPQLQCFLQERSGDKISLEDTDYEMANDLKKVTVSYEKSTN